MKKWSLVASGLAAALVATLIGTAESTPASGGTVAPHPCGATIYKPDGSPWVCTLDEEFNGTTLDPRRWVVQTDFGPGDLLGNQSCTTNSPQNVSVSAGALHLTVRKLASPKYCGSLFPAQYSAGSVMTWRRWSQAYGRFTARMFVPAAAAPGLHEAFWVWHDDRYTQQTTGEMDIAETFSMYPHIAIPNLHTTQNVAVNGVTTKWDCRAWRGYWNTYTMVWSPHRITISLNGNTCLVNTSGDPAFSRRVILLLTAVIGQDKNAATSQTPFPATTLVDYVRVWR